MDKFFDPESECIYFRYFSPICGFRWQRLCQLSLVFSALLIPSILCKGKFVCTRERASILPVSTLGTDSAAARHWHLRHVRSAFIIRLVSVSQVSVFLVVYSRYRFFASLIDIIHQVL
uniref:Transmembrane protein n=1 Tax=Trichogramma kaykai TaxID=54128 RepID=A0ABD2VVQ3_9HYME